MDDPLEVALRRKKVVHARCRAAGQGRRCAGGGVCRQPTGALMAISRYVLKTIDAVSGPAVRDKYPVPPAGTTVLDLGANVDYCRAFVAVRHDGFGPGFGVEEDDAPSVGLLNIGEEAIKGNEVIKQAGELLRAAGKSGGEFLRKCRRQ